MGMFDTSHPSVSKDEFRKAIGHLRDSGFTDTDIHETEMAFEGVLNHPRTGNYGIGAKDIDEQVQWMKANKDKHSLSDHQIDTLHQALKKRL